MQIAAKPWGEMSARERMSSDGMRNERNFQKKNRSKKKNSFENLNLFERKKK